MVKDSYTPRAITILTGGYAVADWFWDNMPDNERRKWAWHDLRDMEKVEGRVKHNEDGFCENTCRTVCMQELFVAKTSAIISDVCQEGYQRVFINCNQGIHRATTVGEMTKAHLNSLQHSTGERFCNAQTFHLWRAGTSNRDRNTIIEQAHAWCVAPWCLLAPWSGVVSDMYGYAACMGHRQSSANWYALFDWVSEHYFRCDETPCNETTANIDANQPVDAVDDQDVDDTTPLVDDVADQRDDAVAAGVHAETPTPPPKRLKPSSAPSSHEVTIVPPPPPAATHYDASTLSKSFVPPPPPAVLPHRATLNEGSANTDGPRAPTYPPPSRESSQSSSTLPDWASFEFNVRAWWELLDHFDMDSSSRQELFLLAQDNKRAANNIVLQLLTKRSERTRPNNPSGWLHSTCRKARDEPPH
jgi:hypothetical protein